MLRRLLVVVSSLTALFLWGACWSQGYPSRPVRMLYVLIDGRFDPGLAAQFETGHE
jgi:hypothetical protein